jgi:exodeoxyribonuclease VII small subunit
MPTKKIDYQKLSEELDEILAKLQSSDLDVDEALKAYERGMDIAKELQVYLKTAENKVTKIQANWQNRAKE